ncbi:MAG: rhodanese-like domain-containing protein [Verrucomicrobiota bacterium]
MKPRSIVFQCGLILGLSAVATLISAVFHPKRPAWYEVVSPEELRWQISAEEAKEIAGTGEVLWVDARARTKFEEEHFPEAILLNPMEWGDLMFENMDRLQDAMGSPVIVYCDGNDCKKSSDVARQLRELLGLEPVYVLKGSWRALIETDSRAGE